MQKVPTEIDSYDWHWIKTRGKVFALDGRVTARFFRLFYAGGTDHAR
jgi:hypothetical protein